MVETKVRDVIGLYRTAGCDIKDWRTGKIIPEHGENQFPYLDEAITGMTDGEGVQTNRPPLRISDFGSGYSSNYSLAHMGVRGPGGWVNSLLVSGPLRYS